MPSIGDKHPEGGVWNGTKWVDPKTWAGGSAKGSGQLKEELGFKAGTKKAPAAPADLSRPKSLAELAAERRPKTMEEQAKAVEAEAKKKQKQ